MADIHFRSDVAHAAAKVAEKVRVNPGNFHKDPEKAMSEFVKLMDICKEYGTAIRIGVNHGSLGEHITAKYGNTPQGMAEAAMEWLRMCIDHNFYNVVISLKASNTVVMVQYSGPASQMVLNRWRKRWEYYLAEQGYVVACFDPRGTDCRGRAFRNASYRQLGCIKRCLLFHLWLFVKIFKSIQ